MRAFDPTPMTRRRRGIAAAGLCLALLVGACGGTEEATSTTSTGTPFDAIGEVTPPTRPDPLAVTDADAETKDRVIGLLAPAIEAVQSQPIEISIEMIEEGEPRNATVRVDQPAEVLESTWVAPLRSGSAVTTRHVVVDGRMFFKSTVSAEAEAALDFTELPYDTNAPEFMDEVYAGYARINKTLDRILVLLENVPFGAQVTETEDGTEISLIMSPIAIYNFYGESGIEAVGGNVPLELTRLAFLVQDGVLRGLVAEGTHFHDGEALEVSATVVYTPIAPFTPEIPPVQE